MDDLRALRVFDRVVELGSFVAAAEALEISRPMASKHIAALEQQLGVSLLRRTTRRLTLTEVGRRFHERTKDLLMRADEAFAEATGLQVEPQGKLRVNAPVEFGRAVVTRMLCELQSQFPGIEIDLTLNDRVVDIVDEGFDLAIRVGVLPDSSLVARRLTACPMTLCAAPAYLEAHGTPTTPESLSEHNCLIYKWLSQGSSWAFHRDTRSVNVKVSGDFVTNYGPATVEAAVAGRGIVLEPAFLTECHLRDGLLVRLLPEWLAPEVPIHVVYPGARLLPAKVRVAVDHLAAAFAAEPRWLVTTQ